MAHDGLHLREIDGEDKDPRDKDPRGKDPCDGVTGGTQTTGDPCNPILTNPPLDRDPFDKDPRDKVPCQNVPAPTGTVNPPTITTGIITHMVSIIPIYGCTDPTACNYDSLANTDDGSCNTVYGCTDPIYTNHNPLATCDDGSCDGIVEYCTIPDPAFRTAIDNKFGAQNWVNGNQIDKSAFDGIWQLQLNNLPITDMTGIECFTDLYHLNVSGCPLGANGLDVSQNLNLGILKCYGDGLTSLDVSANTALTSLNCGANQITDLDLQYNVNLEHLTVRANGLTSLDVSMMPNLFFLYCDWNNLATLNIKNGVSLPFAPNDFETGCQNSVGTCNSVSTLVITCSDPSACQATYTTTSGGFGGPGNSSGAIDPGTTFVS